MRLFLADDGGERELTRDDRPFVRVSATDLQDARRARARIRSADHDPTVILDVTVAVAADFRSAQRALGTAGTAGIAGEPTVHYAGTVDGLVGLIADIGSADVADGVTLIAASPRQDLAEIGRAVLTGLALRDQARAS